MHSAHTHTHVSLQVSQPVSQPATIVNNAITSKRESCYHKPKNTYNVTMTFAHFPLERPPIFMMNLLFAFEMRPSFFLSRPLCIFHLEMRIIHLEHAEK